MRRAIVVIGGGPAGTYAAIAAKKQDPSATVTLLTLEHCEPYEKPPLSKAVLLGTASVGDALIAGPAGVAAQGVVLQTRAHCTAIDRESRAVEVADGRRLPYDALVIATGSTAREITLLRHGTSGVHYLRTEGEARALQSELRSGRHLLVVGGGLIGLEVAAAAATLGVKVTVLEVAPRILARVCDERTGASVHAAHASHGVDIRVSTTLESAMPQPDGRVAVVTNAGARVVADLVVVGTGSKPDTALAAAAGLATDNGIVVDARCHTSDAAIFAAGDAVCFPGPEGHVRLENWRHALDQGTVAGRNAAGGNETYDVVPSFWSEQYGLYIQGVGWQVTGRTPVHRPIGAGNVLVFDVCDGRLVSAMGINAQRELAAARRLIERRIPVDVAALADPAQPLARMLKR
jgi:3-phenylpropionate/trans-cinnamate dioxygenase ferredoxin reductase component